MALTLPTIKAAALSTVFALVLGAMVFAPSWFVLAFFSRLLVGRIHFLTFVVAAAGGIVFFGFTFRMAFSYLREGFSRQATN